MNSTGASALCRAASEAVAAEVLDDGHHFYGVGLPPTGRVEVGNGAAVINGPMPETRFALVPRSAVGIERTWEGVMAVKGSGSHAVSVDGWVVDEGALVVLGAPGREPKSVDALRSGHVLEQCLRDIHGFSVQWERYRSLHYDAGRVLMGATPAHPLF